MKIGIVKETGTAERRVALIPDSIKKLIAKKLEFVLQSGAGGRAYYSDSEYQAAGASVVPTYDGSRGVSVWRPMG